MRSQSPIREKTTEYICFNAMPISSGLFCFTLSPCSWALLYFFFFLYVEFFFLYDVYFFLYLYLALFPWEIFHLINSSAAIPQPFGSFLWGLIWLLSACCSFLLLSALQVSLFCWHPIYVVPFPPLASLTFFYSWVMLLASSLANTHRMQACFW